MKRNAVLRHDTTWMNLEHTVICLKEASHRRPLRIPLYEISTIGKSTETEGKPWMNPQHTVICLKEASHRRPLRIPLYEISTIGKSTETEGKSAVVQG